MALQAAIDSGSSFDLPPGVCVTSASLVIGSNGSNGQAIRGAGAPAANGAGRGKTTIRPSATVSTAFVIDGSPFGGYLQGLALENLGLDMSRMAPGSKGFSQLQAYDVRYAQIRVFNDGGKTSWNFGPGAYTTSLNDVQGSLVYCLGNGVNNPTTITLINPDINGLNVEQCANVTTIGGAVQPAYSASNTVVYVAPGNAPLGFGPNTNGMYLSFNSYLSNSQFFSSLGTDFEALTQPPSTCAVDGWSFGTYNDGRDGCHPIVVGFQIGRGVRNASFINPTFAGMYLLNTGGSSNNTTVTGYQTGGGIGNYNEWPETFDATVYLNNSQALFGFSGDRAGGGSQTFLIDAATGAANFSGGVIAGAAEMSSSGALSGHSLYIGSPIAGTNFASLGQFGCYQAITAVGSSCFMGSGSKFFGYQDSEGTIQTFGIDASTGSSKFRSIDIRPGADGDKIFALDNSSGQNLVDFAPLASQMAFNSGLTVAGYSDDYVTQTWSIDSHNGNAIFNRIGISSELYPGSGTAPQSAGGILAGTGNPSAGTGNNGDLYNRTDCTHGSSNCTWHKEGGVWFDLN